jgi:hypothetical protein
MFTLNRKRKPYDRTKVPKVFRDSGLEGADIKREVPEYYGVVIHTDGRLVSLSLLAGKTDHAGPGGSWMVVEPWVL